MKPTTLTEGQEQAAARRNSPAVSEQSTLLRIYTLAVPLLLALGFALAAFNWYAFGSQEGVPAGLFTQTDFPAVTIASRLAAGGSGEQLYSLQAQLREQQKLAAEGYLALSPGDTRLHYPYPYSPFIALLWAPFTSVSPYTAMAAWDLLNLAAMCAALWVLLRELPLPGLLRPVLALGALGSLPWVVNLEQGQSSGVVALGLGLGVALLRRGRDIPAGLAFGLLLVKVQWIPLIAFALLVGRRWRALGGLLAAGIVLVGLATAVLGPGWITAYAGLAFSASRNGEALLLTPAASHSLNGGLYALFGPGGEGMTALLVEAGTLLIVGVVMLAWLNVGKDGSSDLTRPAARPGWDAAMALTLLAAMLTNPQLNTHDLSLAVLPAALGFSALGTSTRNMGRGAALAWHIGLWTLYFAPLLLLGPLLDPRQPFPVRLTTWALALMLVLMALVRSKGRAS